MAHVVERARAFLAGSAFPFAEVNAWWKQLQGDDELSLARAVLAQLRKGTGLLDRVPADRRLQEQLCQQEALLTSKDPEMISTVRHDHALAVLAEVFDLDDPAMDGDAETLGIAGGIYKRRWTDLGQLRDLIRAATLYERGARGPLGDDAYCHINAAFIEDLLAEAGEEPLLHRERARVFRNRIVEELPATGSWWNTATRAEALFGLRRYPEATQVLASAREKPQAWKLQTTARQLATLAHMHQARPLDNAEIRAFFEALLPSAAEAIRSVMVGKVGLALSGGGFRASFYHLGVLARLAELNVLRHVEVLSCVSGGSIVGACYWLELRRRLLQLLPGQYLDYVELVGELIERFQRAVATDLRHSLQPGKARMVWGLLTGDKGALDPERVAKILEAEFYRPLLPGVGSLYMHELPFTPADHNASLAGSEPFHPGKHNWLRADKVPVLVLNATTVNTAHGWQFTPTWMGESPWAVHEGADSIPRLQWSWYEPAAQWQMELGRAVAASACVPLIFEPLVIDGAYDGIRVQLVDGGVHDNQGTVSLLALDCNVLLVSDACGQLLFEPSPQPGLTGVGAYAMRSLNTLMERVRLANYADLAARRRTGLLRGLMFLHMKAGLDAHTIPLPFAPEAYEIRHALLSPSGVRKEFQQALAELRTDLDAFTPEEACTLMACGYQMAATAFQRDMAELTELWDTPRKAKWVFDELLAEITSTGATTPQRKRLLNDLRSGSKVRV
jgi:predicted acylesterase/phospholipase RssA